MYVMQPWVITCLLKHPCGALQAMANTAIQRLGRHNQMFTWLQLLWNMMRMRLRAICCNGTRRSAIPPVFGARSCTPHTRTHSTVAGWLVQELKFHKEAMKKLGKKRKVFLWSSKLGLPAIAPHPDKASRLVSFCVGP